MIQENRIEEDSVKLLTTEQAWHYGVVPLKADEKHIYLFTDKKNTSSDLIEELEIVLGKSVKLIEEDEDSLKYILKKYYPKSNVSSINNNYSVQSEFKINVQENNFVEQLVKEAKSLRSSDIHIETYGEICRIRFRVDGVLVNRHQLSKSDYPSLVNKLKIASSCDIAEKRLPQDGRIRLKMETGNLDLRVSILPTLYGEKIVLRLLGTDASHISIGSLGFSNVELERYQLGMRKPNGIILISGPTGSGKTTTLYATLKLINKPSNNILTIEDPIEYTLDGVNQVQLKEDIGLTYAEALRTFLRQDPDVIMLGEIRDPQTAQMAIRAALTGHLVLSTIHTNSAWGTVSRLLDMGVPSYLLASTLNLSVAQRLIRILCSDCKQEKPILKTEIPKQLRQLNLKTHFVPVGCKTCYNSGYKGRKAIYEVLDVDNELVEKIKLNVTTIDDYMTKRNIQKLSFNATSLFIKGETSLEETYPYLINEGY